MECINQKLKSRFLKLFLIVILAFSGFFIISSVTSYAGELNFHAVYVGRGDALIVESAGHYMIVDSGTTKGSDSLMSYLDSLNISDNKIDYVISTHPDGDHVGSFPAIFEKYDIGEVIYSPCTKSSDTYTDFIASVKEKGCPYHTPKDGETWTLGDSTVSVVYNGALGSTYNECSIVLKVTCDNKSILLTGDLPSTMERTLMEKGYDFSADILKVGHHGAAASSCATFLDAVSPDYAVISCNKSSTTSLPKPSVLKRLARRFIKTYRTTDDNVVFHIKNGVISTSNKENNGYTSIKRGTLSTAKKSYYSTGKALTPKLNLKVNGKKVSSSNYTAKYTSNTKAGIGKVKVTGTGDKYVGNCSTTFKIKPKTEVVSAKLSGHNKVSLSWSAQSSATGFYLKYSSDKKMSSDLVTLQFKKNTRLSKKIKNLKYDQKYYFRVRAYKSESGNGKWSKKISVKTDPAPVPKKEIINVKVISEKSKAKVTWNKIKSSKNSGYIVQYYPVKKTDAKKHKTTVKINNSQKTAYTIKNLKNNTSYKVRVRAFNRFGKGDWSDIEKIDVD